MTHIRVDARCADIELERLQDGFTGRDHFNLARILFDDFLNTDATVHVDTGSLRASGTVEVNHASSDRWEGHISYGGYSTGVHNPVTYAQVEYFRGGNHDYLRYVDNPDHSYMGAVTSFFARGRSTPHPHAEKG